MSTTPRFQHRRKNSRSPSPSTWVTTLRNTPTRNNTSMHAGNGISKRSSNHDHIVDLENNLTSQQPSGLLQNHNTQSRSKSSSHPPPPPPDLLDDDTSSESSQYLNQQTSWTDPEQLFSSPDLDEDISIHSSSHSNDEGDEDDDDDESNTDTTFFSSVPYFHADHFQSIFPSHPNHLTTAATATTELDEETCANNTVTEMHKQRSKKAVRASTVGAFNTFLKALFGIGMLSNPAVLGEVGLVLGTFCHLFIIVGCAFACYLLLTARQLAVNEVRDREEREAKDIKDYNEYLNRKRNRVKLIKEKRTKKTDSSGMVRTSESREDDTPLRGGANVNLQIGSATPDGWGRCQNSMARAGEVLSPACAESCAGGDLLPPPPPLIDFQDDDNINNAAAMNSVTPAQPQISDPVDNCDDIEPPPSLHRKTSKRNSHMQQVLPTSNSYHRFEDTLQHPQHYSSGYLTMLSNTSQTIIPPPRKSKQVRLVTYGDVAKYLAGPTFAQLMIFTIVSVHLMFASGMFNIAVENLCYIAGWDRLGFSYTDVMYTGDDDWYYGSGRRLQEEQGDNNHNSKSHDNRDNSGSGSHSRDNRSWHNIDMEEAEEEYTKWQGPDFTGRLAMASLLFPLIHGLLQIPSLKELATISTMGLVTYMLGCVGSMMYSAFVLTDFQPFVDRPDDILQFKWSGIPTYVATTIYAIEGINLALPTVNTLEGRDRDGNSHKKKGGKQSDKINSPIKMVVMAVFCYGCVTLFVSWVGLAGGLGGGIGTIHEQEGCRDVTYCLNSVKVQYVYMLSLGVALVLTLPVILYPSTEMLEIWLDERADEKRRKLEMEAEANNVPNYEDMTTKQLKLIRRGILEAEASANNVPNPEKMTTKQLKAVRRSIRSKSLMDNETIISKLDGPDQTKDDNYAIDSPAPEEGVYIEMATITNSAHNTYIPPSCSPTCNGSSPEAVPVKDVHVDPNSPVKDTVAAEERKVRAKRKLKYWKLRMFLAFLICFIGTLEGSFPQIVRAAEVIRGVGLSMAGLISPPLLYMSAVGGRFSAGMASAMALLIGLGLFNIVLVLMSAFGGKDYIIEEGPGHYHNSFYELDE